VSAVDDAIAGREVVQVDHNRAGTRMRVVVQGEDGREESLTFQAVGGGGEWRLVGRGSAPVDLEGTLEEFRRF